MNRIDVPSASPTLPTPDPAGTSGYFTKGNPLTAVAATIVDQDFMNSVQEELLAVILAAGIPPSKTNNAQLLQALFLLHGVQYFVPGGSGNFTVPPGVYSLDVEVWGGGGSGGGCTVGNFSGGGAGGGYARKRCAVTPGQVIAATVAAVAIGGASTGANGAAGGTSTFGAFCSATGGSAGIGATAGGGLSLTPGNGSGGDINFKGGPGGNGGAAPINGGYAGNAFCSPGGNSGGAGSKPEAGTFPGAGGRGTAGAAAAGGDAAGGLIVVRW